jgi:hypothetical protein
VLAVSTRTPEAAAKGSGLVLLTLAAGQFLMTLDSSVMNVSIATVAKDVGTIVTGIQREPSGRWGAEHRDEPGRLDRHGPGRLDPDRRAD